MTESQLAYFRQYRKENRDAVHTAYSRWHEANGKARYYRNVDLTRAIKRKSYYMRSGNTVKADQEQQLIDAIRSLQPREAAGVKARYSADERVIRRRACVRKARYKHVQGIPSLEEPGACEVCGNGGKICMDHNHQTSRFRGWLCNDCNLVIGRAKDDVTILKALVKYLEERE